MRSQLNATINFNLTDYEIRVNKCLFLSVEA